MGLLSPRLTAGTRQAWQRRQGFYRYDKEQAELTEKIEQYEREGRAEHDQLDKIQDFIDEVSKYAGITELNYKILHQLIDKILVSKAEKVDGEYVQKIQIFYRFIGPLDAIE